MILNFFNIFLFPEYAGFNILTICIDDKNRSLFGIITVVEKNLLEIRVSILFSGFAFGLIKK